MPIKRETNNHSRKTFLYITIAAIICFASVIFWQSKPEAGFSTEINLTDHKSKIYQLFWDRITNNTATSWEIEVSSNKGADFSQKTENIIQESTWKLDKTDKENKKDTTWTNIHNELKSRIDSSTGTQHISWIIITWKNTIITYTWNTIILPTISKYQTFKKLLGIINTEDQEAIKQTLLSWWFVYWTWFIWKLPNNTLVGKKSINFQNSKGKLFNPLVLKGEDKKKRTIQAFFPEWIEIKTSNWDDFTWIILPPTAITPQTTTGISTFKIWDLSWEVFFLDSNWDTGTVEMTVPIPLIYVGLPIQIQYSNDDVNRQDLTTTTGELINWSGYIKFVTSHFTTFNLSAWWWTFNINNDDLYVNSTSVTLYNNVPYADQMKFWNTYAAVSAAWWSTYNSTSAWTLTSVWWGMRTVYAMFRNSKDWSQITISDTIVYWATDNNLAIKLYYFGTWSEFTQNRITKNWCNPSTMNVVNVPSYNDNTSNRMPTTLAASTIYVLNSWYHLATGEIIMWTCTAIVWSWARNRQQYGNVKLFWTTQTTSMINLYDGNYIIVDNVALDWYNNWAWATHAKTNYWLYWNNYNAGTYWSITQQFSLRNSKIANFNQWLLTYWPYGNYTIKYSEIFNNTDRGIYIQSDVDRAVTIDESSIYNNAYWIYVWCTSPTSQIFINNTNIFNNTEWIYQICNTASDNVVYTNHSSIYNNGIWMRAYYTYAHSHVNNSRIFNNTTWLSANSGSFFLYWNTYLYQNWANTQINWADWSVTMGSAPMPLWRNTWTPGTWSRQFSRNDIINPLNKNNNTYLFNRTTTNFTTIRGKISSWVDFIPNTNISRNGNTQWTWGDWIRQWQPVVPWWSRWITWWSIWFDRNPDFPIWTQKQPIDADTLLTEDNTFIVTTNKDAFYTITGNITKTYTWIIKANTPLSQKITFASTSIWLQQVTIILETGLDIAHYTNDAYFCVNWRSNNNFINNYFRAQSPTNAQILCAVLGSWDNNITQYTLNQSPKCNPSSWSFSTLNAGTNTITTPMAGNTVYLLNPWTYDLTSVININTWCNIVLWKGNKWSIIVQWMLWATTTNSWVINLNSWTYAKGNILDNLIINWNWSSNADTCISLNWATRNTFNNITANLCSSVWILVWRDTLWLNSDYNNFYNTKVVNTLGWSNMWAITVHWSNNIFNNIEIYNNRNWSNNIHWIRVRWYNAGQVARSNVFNNTIIYNNGTYWIYLPLYAEYNTFSNIMSFNNQLDWINLEDVTTRYNIFNNCMVYNNARDWLRIWWGTSNWANNNTINNCMFFNNGSYWMVSIVGGTAPVWNKYYNKLYIFDNTLNNWTGVFSQWSSSDYSYLKRTTWEYLNNLTTKRDIITNPRSANRSAASWFFYQNRTVWLERTGADWAFFSNITSVSYTHLDVYKRQIKTVFSKWYYQSIK